MQAYKLCGDEKKNLAVINNYNNGHALPVKHTYLQCRGNVPPPPPMTIGAGNSERQRQHLAITGSLPNNSI